MTSVVLAALNATVVAQDKCQRVPGGSFDLGFDGWQIVPTKTEEGNASAFAEHSIQNGSGLFPPLDSSVAVLTCVAYAAGFDSLEGGMNAAGAQLSISSDPVELTDRYLTFWTAGSFESLRFGSAQTALIVTVAVNGPNQISVTHKITNFTPPPFPSCEWGISVLGTFAVDEPRVIDLFSQDGKATGLSVGDMVTLNVTVLCTASAVEECEEGEMAALFGIDNLQFCPAPPGSVIGDVTGDGVVDVDDLLELINSWGGCENPPKCPADLTGNGIVDVDDLLIVINHWT